MPHPLAKFKEHFIGQAPSDTEAAEASEQQRGQHAEPSNSDQPPSVDWSSLVKPLEEIKRSTVETLTNVTAHSLQIKEQLARIERTLTEFVAVVTAGNDEDRTHFTPAEFAQKAVKDGARDHLTARTVQKWCREGRIKGIKQGGRGKDGEWVIPRKEYLRWRNKGHDPDPKTS